MRNRSIRSVLARRPMFANGGMLPPVTQSPLASGILGSSSPLIETVNNQQSPDRGVRVSMANGGVARLQRGGVPRPGQQYTTFPSLSIKPLPPGSEGLGSAAEPYELTSETLSNLADPDLRKRMERIFPEWRSPGGRSWEQAGFGVDKGSRGERLLHGAASAVKDFASSIGGYAGAFKDYAFSEEAREKGYSPSQIQTITKMKELRPNLAGDIQEISEKIISEWGSDIAGEELAQAVSYGLSLKHENVGSLKDEALQSEDYVSDKTFDQIVAESQVDDEEIAFGPQKGPFAEIKAKYPKMPDDVAAEVRVQMEGNPGTDIETIVNASFPKEWIEEWGITVPPPEALDEARLEASKEAEGELMDVEVAEGEGEPPSQIAKEEDGPPSQLAKVVPTEKPPVPEADEQPEVSQAKMVGDAFNKKDKIPEAKRGLKDYITEFKESAPGYKGMTDMEKGLAIAEAGFRVMAGHSSNAIINIGVGLKGISKEFIADKKARRAFDQQVDLSAVKYGMTAQSKDRAQAASDLRNIKYLAFTEDHTDPSTGRSWERGESFRMSMDDILNGRYEKYPLGLPSTVQTMITADASLQKAKDKLVSDKKLRDLIGDKALGHVTKSQELHNDALSSIRNGTIMVGLIDSVIGQNAAENIAGLRPYLQDKIQKLHNATNWGALEKLGNTNLALYNQKMQFIANRMIKEMLGEGSKNISNVDRDLAEQIVGLLKNQGTVFASDEVLHDTLQRVRGVITDGLIKNYNVIGEQEEKWINRMYPGGASPLARMQTSRQRVLGKRPTQLTFGAGRETPGPSFTLKYSAVIGPDGKLKKGWDKSLRRG